MQNVRRLLFAVLALAFALGSAAQAAQPFPMGGMAAGTGMAMERADVGECSGCGGMDQDDTDMAACQGGGCFVPAMLPDRMPPPAEPPPGRPSATAVGARPGLSPHPDPFPPKHGFRR